MQQRRNFDNNSNGRSQTFDSRVLMINQSRTNPQRQSWDTPNGDPFRAHRGYHQGRPINDFDRLNDPVDLQTQRRVEHVGRRYHLEPTIQLSINSSTNERNRPSSAEHPNRPFPQSFHPETRNRPQSSNQERRTGPMIIHQAAARAHIFPNAFLRSLFADPSATGRNVSLDQRFHPLLGPFIPQFQDDADDQHSDTNNSIEREFMSQEIEWFPWSLLQAIQRSRTHRVSNLSDGEIHQIPVRRYQKSTSDNGVCPICFDEFENEDEVKSLECKHIFHATCIDPWLKESRQCPICRHEHVSK